MDFLLQVLTSLFADNDDLRLKGAPLAFLIIYVVFLWITFKLIVLYYVKLSRALRRLNASKYNMWG